MKMNHMVLVGVCLWKVEVEYARDFEDIDAPRAGGRKVGSSTTALLA